LLFSICYFGRALGESDHRSVKILLTADLHFHRPWFDWLRSEAPFFDLICIAGDVFDLEHPAGLLPQMIFLYTWVSDLGRQRTPVALCTGNHDLPPGISLVRPGVSIASTDLPVIGHYAKATRWIQALKLDHQFAVDGDEKIVRTKSGESITVICCRYRADGRVDQWKPSTGKSLVLHHEPPANSQLAIPKAGNPELSLILEKLRPTWCMSGHVHFSPGEQNQFFERIGNTICFNCRQNPPADRLPARPNTIVLDTSAATAAWRRWFSATSYDEIIARLD
jgi:Icc-related predicted phosphoesterase